MKKSIFSILIVKAGYYRNSSNVCLGADRDNDGDVDGSDLAFGASPGAGSMPDLATFADEFGHTDCLSP